MTRKDRKVVDLAARRRERARRPVDSLDRQDRRVLLAMLFAALLVGAMSLYRCSISQVEPTVRDLGPTSEQNSDWGTTGD